MYRLVLQSILCLFLISRACCDGPEVEISQGRLLGGTRTNRNGDTYYSFQNIPYGKPPLDELRFKAPEAADGWEGTRDATEDLPACIASMGGGEEDCLYLNVFTPGLPAENVTKLPVIIQIYGGAFSLGSAQESTFGAQYLLTKDVVFAVFNYRLGIYGFLSLDDPNLGVTGNAGLKDQSLALQWIQDNIEYFGGDPNNVMIMGGSAGAMSVHFHILSSMSKGLFQKAVSQSGVALTRLVMPDTRNNALLVAEALGIQTDDWTEMVASLRSASTGDLSRVVSSLQNTYEYLIRPIIEITSNEPTFITELPINIIRSGEYNQVPFIVGFNSAEGLIDQISSKMMTGENILIEDFTEFIPLDLEIESGSEEEAVLAQKIKEAYYGDEEPNREDISGAIYLITDFGFGFPAYRTAIEHLKTALNPIYFYYFNADTELNQSNKMDEVAANFPGASHGDEIAYQFYTSSAIEVAEGSVEDLSIKNQINFLTNFAIYGDPSPSSFDDFKWEPITEDQFNYLEINSGEAHDEPKEPVADRLKFWVEVYEDYLEKK